MPIDPRRIKNLFVAALDLPDLAARQAFLDRECAGESELRQRLEVLLQAHDAPASALNRPLAEIAPEVHDPALTTNQSISEVSGTVIGPYKLIEPIGEGGMGTVWMAQQTEPVKRLVALKLIKAGMDSRQVIARFEAERQALALMDHPNIAKVLDAGTVGWKPDALAREKPDSLADASGFQGKPYFVMELVKGVPITRYCDEHHLTPRQRLELFVPVCQAIQHAHQKGIIHRDLKPSNVLVALYDDKPVPKIIDFGVAKATGQQLTEQTLNTGFGAVVGTLEYMSPEQAGFNQLDIDTRSDIYSLGVLLYELLAGSPPFTRRDLEQAGLLEMLRVIREQEPSKPSTKLSSSDALPSLSANRGTEPAKLARLVRGELDWIVMKALEKDRSRRYETASGFAQDLQRYLADEPVQACPPSAGYRLRKFVRRNKTQVAFAAVVLLFLVLLGGGVGYTISERASRQARVAAEVEQILDETNRLMKDAKWPEALAAGKRAEAALASGDTDDATQDRVRQILRELDLVLRLEDARLRSFEIQQGKRGWAGANQRFAQLFAEFGLDIDNLTGAEAPERLRRHPAVTVELAAGLTEWARIRWQLDEKQHDLRNLVLLNVADQLDPDSWRTRLRAHWKLDGPVDKSALVELAAAAPIKDLPTSTLVMLGNLLETKVSPAEGAKLLRKAQVLHPGDFGINYALAGCCSRSRPPRHDEAVEYLRAALAVRPTNIAAWNNLGAALADNRKFEEASGYYRKAIELDPRYALAHSNLGVSLDRQKKLDDAIACYRKAIELDPKFALGHSNLGDALRRQKKLDEAIACLRKAIELDQKLAWAHTNLGAALAEQNQLDEAIVCHRKAIELDSHNALAYVNLGVVLEEQKKLDEAIACYRRAIELDPTDAKAHIPLGSALGRQKKLDEAVPCFRKAIELDPTFAIAHTNLGITLRDQKKLDEAIVCFRKAIELDPTSVSAHNGLGGALRDQKKLDEAIVCFRKAIELDPTSVSAHNGLGGALRDQKKLDEAIVCFRKAIKLDPNSALLHSNLGLAVWDQNKRDEAIACFRKAIDLDSKHAGAHENWFSLGVLHVTGGDLGSYRKLCSELVKRYGGQDNPGMPRWWISWCCKLAPIEEDDLKRVVELARQAVDQSPKDARLCHELGAILYRSGAYAESVRIHQSQIDALTAQGKTPGVHDLFWLAMGEAGLGRYEQAREALRKGNVQTKAVLARNVSPRFRLELELLQREAAEVVGLPPQGPQDAPPTNAANRKRD
jgi:tetratricopeptide (TPR) repeat protein/serine/threonine protein kinase